MTKSNTKDSGEPVVEFPHAYGCASCDDCGYGWVAVWPLGADALECPKCHSTNTDREQEVK